MSKHIKLGYPLDLLFNRKCKFKDYEDEINIDEFKEIDPKINLGGLELPKEDYTGSGNIIIRGKPGTAKSTLAMQLAVSAGFNHLYSFYFTLEESPDNTLKKVTRFGWNSICKILDEPCNNDINNQTYIESLIASCQKNDHKVIISSLSPRNVFKEKDDDNSLFHKRYKQLERILIETSIYNKRIEEEKLKGTSKVDPVGIICIDSLNVFGDTLLSRTEIFRLFELFKQYKILGIFIVEEDEKLLFSDDNKLHGQTIEYVSDIVVSLTTGEDDGYSMRYFEITKSRYQHQIYGIHPFKIFERDQKSKKKSSLKAIRVFPSLHFLVYGTDAPYPKIRGNKNNSRNDFFFDPSVILYLPDESFSTILIEGPRATFKSTLARDFLMKGLFNDKRKNENNKTSAHVLIIRFHDRPSSENNAHLQQFFISEECNENLSKIGLEGNNIWGNFKNKISEKENSKRFLNSYVYETESIKFRYSELVFKSGYVFPEELINIFLETLKKIGKPTRIVIDEIGRIGSSYPLLFKSKTAGELFITALVHIIRNYRIKLVLTGTTGEYDKSDHEINIARTLVDTIIETDNINVFGDNYVIIKGEGLRASELQTNIIENVPGAILPLKDGLFKIEKDKFYGLVGFDTDNIYRPELDLYLFSENTMHSEYKKEVLELLKYALSYGGDNYLTKKNLEITTHSIDDSTSTAFHDSLGLLKGRPIKKTVICTVDEFSINKEFKNLMIRVSDELIDYCKINKSDNELDKHFLPYYDNVLVLVYNLQTDLTSEEKKKLNNWTFNSWKNLIEKIEELKNEGEQKEIKVDFKSSVEETLSCLLLDAIFASIKESGMKYDKNLDIYLDEQIRELLSWENGRNLLLENMNALSEIIRKSDKSYSWRGRKIKDGEEEKDKKQKGEKTDIEEKEQFLEDSTFYICWYSELRELIKSYPYLASQLFVYSLPGGGFTGDWRIALMKGSVSVNLGFDVLKLLCAEEEDYKRFVMGVGLPTNSRFYKGQNFKENVKSKFLAWPNSRLIFDDQNENLDRKILNDIKANLNGTEISYNDIPQIFKLYYIHEQANRRSKIKNYKAIRHALVILFKQLIQLDDKEEIGEIIIDRIANIIGRFSKKDKDAKQNFKENY